LLVLLLGCGADSLIGVIGITLHHDFVGIASANSAAFTAAKITTDNLRPAVVLRGNSIGVVLSFRVTAVSTHGCEVARFVQNTLSLLLFYVLLLFFIHSDVTHNEERLALYHLE